MALRRNQSIDASALAERHAKAVTRRDQAIEEATANYEGERRAVIETGAQRIAEITLLERELAKERESLVGVLHDPAIAQA